MIITVYILLFGSVMSAAILLFFQNHNLRHSISILTKDIDKEKEMDACKQSFVATITHDLKTPTNAQINILNLLLNGNFGKLTPQQHEMLSLTRSSCTYMSELIGIIMDSYCSDYGGLKLNYEKFDIVNLIEFQCRSLKSLTKKHNQNIVFETNYKNLTVSADKLQIRRVILNLLSNAITYAYENSSIVVKIISDDNNFDFSVENMSLPIPENELRTIFDKYKKTKYSKFNKAGNGLGLYLSKQIVELHGGNIYARSSQNGSCVFGFRIPLGVAPAPDGGSTVKI